MSLTDATVENGCVSVMPGAHRDGTLAHAETPIGFECWGDHDRAVDVPTAAGDIVVFSSLSPHATRVNTTDEVRRAYIVQYCHADAVAHSRRRVRRDRRADGPERPPPPVRGRPRRRTGEARVTTMIVGRHRALVRTRVPRHRAQVGS